MNLINKKIIYKCNICPQGQWEKGKGMYEYEKGSKSSQKQTSGKAVVPVCLPLCCAMPCTIM